MNRKWSRWQWSICRSNFVPITKMCWESSHFYTCCCKSPIALFPIPSNIHFQFSHRALFLHAELCEKLSNYLYKKLSDEKNHFPSKSSGRAFLLWKLIHFDWHLCRIFLYKSGKCQASNRAGQLLFFAYLEAVSSASSWWNCLLTRNGI